MRTPSSWSSQELIARLDIQNAGRSESLTETMTVENDSSVDDPASTFNFQVPSSLISTNTNLSVAILRQAGGTAESIANHAAAISPRRIFIFT